jgi:hypothetical protein
MNTQELNSYGVVIIFPHLIGNSFDACGGKERMERASSNYEKKRKNILVLGVSLHAMK